MYENIACPLTTSKLHQWVAFNDIVSHDMVDHEIVDSGLHALCPVHITIAHVVEDGELEAFQPGQSSRGRQRHFAKLKPGVELPTSPLVRTLVKIRAD